MAQIGSFVPAAAAEIGVCDRLFVRVGASDDLARGRSTFMVEMSETALILNQATDRSLVLLDEIGRGTSTLDGLSIAWAVAESMHDKVQARTIFATHYHELIGFAEERAAAVNMHIGVREWGERGVPPHAQVGRCQQVVRHSVRPPRRHAERSRRAGEGTLKQLEAERAKNRARSFLSSVHRHQMKPNRHRPMPSGMRSQQSTPTTSTRAALDALYRLKGSSDGSTRRTGPHVAVL